MKTKKNQILENIFDDKPKEECGVFGIVAPKEEVSKLTYFGLYALQHRGQESCGIATFSQNGYSLHKDVGLVNQVFSEEILSGLEGDICIGHTRYSTTGVNSSCNAQPMIVSFNGEDFGLAHNGNLVNANQMKEFLENEGYSFDSTTDSEVILKFFIYNLQKTKDIKKALLNSFTELKGAYSIVISTNDMLMAIRDTEGLRPLCLGKTVKGQHVIASESCALDIIGAGFEREILPGEILLIDKNQNLESVLISEDIKPHHCIFELIYFSRPDSIFNKYSIYHFRKQFGMQLAKEAPVDADYVITVPDSGTPAAIGYAEELKLPFTDALIKNRYVGRTFIQPTQMLRELGIRLKLNPLKDIIAGKKIVVVDDSIVRGNTSKKIVNLLRDSGAKEVHMRLSSPPIKWPCFYGIDIDSREQLIAAKTNSIEEINKYIGADSLQYLSIDGMVKATGLSENIFCTACFSGIYPTKIPSELEGAKFRYEKIESKLPT